MKDQHKLIKGYRDLSAEEIALMNEIKGQGAALAELCLKVRNHVERQVTVAYHDDDEDEMERLAFAQPSLWLDDATREFQVALMKLVRAVAQPTTF